MMYPMMIVLTISNNKTPNINIPINNVKKLICFLKRSLTKPIRYATTGYKNKNPDEGPANTAIPPRPPDNSGKPVATNNKNIITLSAPYLRPNITPAKKIPIFCNTIGTGINGKGIPGTRPKIQIIAVINAVYTKFFVLI